MDKKKLNQAIRKMKPKTYSEEEVVKIILNLRETLSDLEHRQWNHLTGYFATLTPDKLRAVIYSQKYRDLRMTEYKNLSEELKDSDREWTDKVISVILNKFMTPAGFRFAIDKAGIRGLTFSGDRK